jgi:hypothetical protein
VPSKNTFARVWVIGGFALAALGAIVNVAVLAYHGELAQGSSRFYVSLIAAPLGSFGTLWAWWLLSKLSTLVDDHASLFRSAFLGLMVASSCLCVEYVNILWSDPRLDQYTVSFWLDTIGSGVVAIGFLFMSLSFTNVLEPSPLD